MKAKYNTLSWLNGLAHECWFVTLRQLNYCKRVAINHQSNFSLIIGFGNFIIQKKIAWGFKVTFWPLPPSLTLCLHVITVSFHCIWHLFRVEVFSFKYFWKKYCKLIFQYGANSWIKQGKLDVIFLNMTFWLGRSLWASI